MEEASNSEVHDLANNQHGATHEDISTAPQKGEAASGDRLRVSPLARRTATDKGVDVSQLQGSGPSGRIIQRDVLAAAESGAAKGPTTSLPPVVGEKQTTPLTKMRSAIATALQRSKQLVPHFYVTVDVDMEEVVRLRERMNKQLEAEKIKLSVGDFVTRAVAATLAKHPGLNSHFNGEKAEITRFGDVNLGMAVALPEGLIVPVLRGAQRMGLKEIRQKSVDLVDRARAQKLKREELSGATFTISNLGMFGVKEFNAIINPPEVGILAVSAAEKRAVVRGDQIVARSTMSLTLSADHRAVDGAAAAEFMRTLKGLLEDPAMMLA
jgi:pyruvate dehydrogenase E2 component (dihydrolipoamide acetyltransferase)